jgi:hypothetical protein
MQLEAFAREEDNIPSAFAEDLPVAPPQHL